MSNQLRVSVVVPAYNEENTIANVIETLDSLTFIDDVVVVNDASTDNTRKILENLNFTKLTIVHHEKNFGKTEALKTGFKSATGDIICIQDADLEYDPNELQFLLEPIFNNKADVVYGSRFMVRKASRVLYFYHFLANKSLTFISNLFTNKNMSDIETCYKVFRADLIRSMPISSKGFGFEVEVTAKISKTKARIFEAPISYFGRTYEDGKKIVFTDGIYALWYIFKYNLVTSRRTQKYIQHANKFLKQ